MDVDALTFRRYRAMVRKSMQKLQLPALRPDVARQEL
jgi:hypothetical protein